MQDFSVARPIHGGNLTWAASLVGCSPSKILDFSASINPLGPPPSAIASIQAHLGDLRDYPDPSYHSLRQALADVHHIDPAWVLPGNGSAELLTWASRELATGPVYLMTPAFQDYYRALKAFDATVMVHPLPVHQLTDADALHHSLDRLLAQSPPATAGLLLNNPHNPTGQLLSQDRVLSCLQHFKLVVVDEAFMDFLPPAQQQSVIAQIEAHPNLVVLRSLTKFYSLPGLRLGYAIAHPDRLRQWQQWRDPWSVNTLAAAAMAGVVQDHAFQQQTWEWLPPARAQLLAGLQAIPGLTPFPGTANFLLVRSPLSTVQLQRDLLHHGHILIRDCVSFPELGDRYFRVAVRTQTENQHLLDGLSAVLGSTS